MNYAHSNVSECEHMRFQLKVKLLFAGITGGLLYGGSRQGGGNCEGTEESRQGVADSKSQDFLKHQHFHSRSNQMGGKQSKPAAKKPPTPKNTR